VTLNFDL